jgi:hypothetical protein
MSMAWANDPSKKLPIIHDFERGLRPIASGRRFGGWGSWIHLELFALIRQGKFD